MDKTIWMRENPFNAWEKERKKNEKDNSIKLAEFFKNQTIINKYREIFWVNKDNTPQSRDALNKSLNN
jgi:DNA-binding XRE family transcriptional regulator